MTPIVMRLSESRTAMAATSSIIATAGRFVSFQCSRFLHLDPVPPASRRIFLYWLLLLVPTLVVGVFAMYLLQREQARIVVQGEYAEEARRAAVTARARLVVENVELLVGDVQSALLDTLATEPANGLEAFMDSWEGSNPLVRTAFLCEPDGDLLRPSLRTANEDARGFVRRFAEVLKDNPPWSGPAQAARKTMEEDRQKAFESERQAQREIRSNVLQVQSARRDVQELAKSRGYASNALPSEASPSAERPTDEDAASTSPEVVDRSSSSTAVASADGRREAATIRGAQPTSPALRRSAPLATAALEAKQAGSTAGDRRGWTAVTRDGRLHLIGWIQPNGESAVRGVELELAALISRLGGTLPVEITGNEGYALQDDQDRVVHQIGAVGRGSEEVARIPLSDQTLPGWAVAGYAPLGAASSVDGLGFFWSGSALIGLFVVAILAGGFLLLQQARRSELEALQKTSFVGNVSHEFKTPLTTIRLYSELLEQGRVRDEQQGGEYLRTISRETERLARLVNNALDFSRLEQGQKKYARERVDLAAEMRRLIETHSPRVADAGMNLAQALADEPVFATVDRDAVEQIVLNLIDNACKYAAEGGEVLISVAAVTGGGAEVRVADRGPGVPENQRERIFEKFHRVDDALTAEKSGAGLGLSIARQLARGLGGDLQFKPREGGGAEFILKLP